jgi:hypothetical protein
MPELKTKSKFCQVLSILPYGAKNPRFKQFDKLFDLYVFNIPNSKTRLLEFMGKLPARAKTKILLELVGKILNNNLAPVLETYLHDFVSTYGDTKSCSYCIKLGMIGIKNRGKLPDVLSM